MNTPTSTTTTERTDAALASLTLLPAETVAAQIDEDAVLDSWLASLELSEFEMILGRLADGTLGGRMMLEPSA